MIRLYLLGGVLLAFLALGLTTLWYRGQAIGAAADRDRARADLVVAVSANEEATRAIDALQEQARMDSRLTASLVEEMRKINQAMAAQTDALTDLEKSNADVRSYLDTVVPGDLRRLYNR